MICNAYNGCVNVPGGEMDYIRFGKGDRVLVILPGLGDGLQTVKGTALPMALMYRRFAEVYTVYAFSRKRQLPQGHTTRDMAEDQNGAMEALGIRKADVMGVSMGGMIAQHLASQYPDKVNQLVLVASAAAANPMILENVTQWVEQAQRGDHRALMDSNVRKIYSEAYYRKNKWMIPIMGVMTKPRSYDRFLVQARACMAHDAVAELGKIRARTLVIAGGQDNVLGDGHKLIVERIENAQVKLYPQWGHGLYDEAKDFQQTVLEYLTRGE